MNILHIDSSPRMEGSASRELSALLVARLQARGDAAVIRRDLCAPEIPHLRGSTLAQIRNVEPERGEADMELTRQLIAELLDAQVLVVGAPMYNFAIPTQLKAWIDRVVWAGKTFRYTQQGPEGLCRGKRAYIVSTRGGIYSTPEKLAWDFQENYLRTVLGFIGIEDVHVLRAEGLALSPERREAAIDTLKKEMAGAVT